jgi:hypothetical protein
MAENTRNIYLIDVNFEIESTQQEAVEFLQKVEEFVRECGGKLYKLELGQSPF